MKLKVTFLTDDFPPHAHGGAGLIAYEEARALSEMGHDVLVITTTQDKTKVGDSMSGRIRVKSLFSNYDRRFRAYISIWNPPVVRQIKKILTDEQPDIIHAHNVHTHISYKALDVARYHTRRLFLTAHDAMLVHYGKFMPSGNLEAGGFKNVKEYGWHANPLRSYFIRRFIQKVDAIFAVSQALKELLVYNGIGKVHVLYNGIDGSYWKNIDDVKKSSFISRFGLSGAKVVLFAGRVSGLKGGKALEEAMKLVKKEIPEARLFTVGGEVKIDRDEMKYAYAVADVVVVPSLYLDPFPTVNLEAMASSKPVIGTKEGGTKEAVRDGVTGYIIDPSDTVLFAQRIIELLGNAEKARGFGRRGYERFKEKFTIDIHIQTLLAWYNSASL
jgi:glycosyltransferase involved in cell wall biosynthesis